MRKIFLLFSLLAFTIASLEDAAAQADTIKYQGMKVIVPTKEKKNDSYLYIAGGLQMPGWYRVPMVPEFPKNMVLDGNMKVKSPGWFCGVGIMKKTKSHFEIGILADFYKTSIPVAYSGQRSTSDWVLEQTANLSEYTAVFENEIDRVSQVYSFRAAIRYKIPVGKFQFWGGIAPGTFSSRVYFLESNSTDTPREYRETSFGLTYSAGIDFMVKDNKGKDKMRFTLFSDFGGPKIEEKFISLFHKPAWKFLNTEGNNVINPVRIGFSIGLH